MHRVANVGGHQPRGDVQTIVAQLSDPAREEPQRQGVSGRHLNHLALPAFQMMQMAQDFTQLIDHGARRHQEQLAGRRQFDRRTRAVDQGQPQRGLKAANTAAEGRLGHKAALGRLGKATGRRQGTEVFQPFAFEVHLSLQACTKMAHARMSVGVTSTIMPFVHRLACNSIGRKIGAGLGLAPFRHVPGLTRDDIYHVRCCIVPRRKRPAWHP
ncbi:hypothetical protein D3C84_760410 [compost metagenome]